MNFLHPAMVAIAVVVTAAAITGYLMLQKRRRAVVANLGLVTTSRVRRHLPYALFLAAIPLLLLGLARPVATLDVPRVSGTVMLVFDVSNSMAADDVKPTRLAAAQAAATDFVDTQPDTVDIGVVLFAQGALMTQAPSGNHDEALTAINRLSTSGATSLGQAILASLSAIVGEPITLEGTAEQPLELGYWGSATIVLFSDGQDTGGPDAEAAALLAADAGVRIETVGIGTTAGTTIEVDGYQMATALNEGLLYSIAATTGGSYRQAQDATSLVDISRSIDLRITTQEEPVELTALLAAAALLLLTVGGVLMIRWYGRIV